MEVHAVVERDLEQSPTIAIAFFHPGIASQVIAAFLPEAWLIRSDQSSASWAS